MDTSKIYIKMCDHPKIQEDWKPQVGNVCSIDGQIHIVIMDIIAWLMKQDATWLPRQDEIQEMIGNFEKCVDIITSLEDEIGFFTAYTGFPPTKFIQFSELPRFGSMEKLWLCIYMHEKYKLVWDGEKWIKNRLKNS